MMPVSVVASWRLWAIPLLAAVVTGYAVWFVQAVRLDNVRLEAARAAAQEAARAQEQIFQTRIHEATHAHQETLARVRADGRSARAELDRLRDTLAQPYGLSPRCRRRRRSQPRSRPRATRRVRGNIS